MKNASSVSRVGTEWHGVGVRTHFNFQIWHGFIELAATVLGGAAVDFLGAVECGVCVCERAGPSVVRGAVKPNASISRRESSFSKSCIRSI